MGLLLLSAAASISLAVEEGRASAGLLLWVEGEPVLQAPWAEGETIGPGLVLKSGRTIVLRQGRGVVLWADGSFKVLEPGQELTISQPVSKAGDEGMITTLASVLRRVHQAGVGNGAGPLPGDKKKIRLIEPRNSAILAADLSFHWSGHGPEEAGPDKARLVLKAARVGYELALPVKLSSGRTSLPAETDKLLPGLRYSWRLRTDGRLLSAPAWFTILNPGQENHLRKRMAALRRLKGLSSLERRLVETELLAAYGLFNRAARTLEEILDLEPGLTSARELADRIKSSSQPDSTASDRVGPSLTKGEQEIDDED